VFSRMPGARAESNLTTLGLADAVMDDCNCGALSHIVRFHLAWLAVSALHGNGCRPIGTALDR
jgi:hypothetical protein